MVKKIKGDPQGVWDYQTVAAQENGKPYKAEKFCRSCGADLPPRLNPIGIQLFYCQPNCAFDAAVHAAAKGYASHLYVEARRAAKEEAIERRPSAEAIENFTRVCDQTGLSEKLRKD